MKLAKNHIDVGVQTNQREAMLAFWGEAVGLPFEELLKVGGGTHQLRHKLNGAVFKLNHVRDELPANDPTGYAGLLIAREGVTVPEVLTDPDGNVVTLVPPGYRGVTTVGVTLRVSSLARHQHFFGHVLEAEQLTETSFCWGTTVFLLEESAQAQRCQSMRGLGYRYITVQVWDVDAEHAGVLARGGEEGRAPTTLGSTARISFVRDPDGNWIEISQRASLTGAL